MTTTLQLHSGDKLPAIGLGFWKIERDAAASVATMALESGYRHFDCACDYGNEAEVGEGLQSVLSHGIRSRSELWITSKLWNTYHHPNHVRPALQRTLADLRLDYLDLYLIHFPIALKYVPFDERYPPEWFHDPGATRPRMEFEPIPIAETWKAMEAIQREGLAKNIGVCNFNCALLRDLLANASIPPAVLQVELHPYLTQEPLVRYCQSEGIAVTAFSPLGAQSYFSLGMADPAESLLNHTVVRDIAAGLHRTPAQVLLRWGVQRGTAVVPKSAHPERLKENLQIFDFELSGDAMKRIAELNRNRRFNDPGVFGEAAFNTFCPIYD